MPFVMNNTGKSNNSRLPRKARIGLGILHNTFAVGDSLQLIRNAKQAVGDKLVGVPEMVISGVPAMVNDAIAGKNPEVLGYLKAFGIDPAQDPNDQDEAVICQKIREYLNTL